MTTNHPSHSEKNQATTIIEKVATSIWEDKFGKEEGKTPTPTPQDINTTEPNIIKLHKTWITTTKNNPAKPPPHPLIQPIETWILHQISNPANKHHPTAILKHPMGSFRETSFTECKTGETRQFNNPPTSTNNIQYNTPFKQDESIIPATQPLIFQGPIAHNVKQRTGIVPFEIRIFFETLFALEPNQHKQSIFFKLKDLIQYLYPEGNFRRKQQLPLIILALENIHWSGYIPWIDNLRQERIWRPVIVRSPIDTNADTNTLIFIDIALPPNAKQGYAVDKHTHRTLAATSAPKFNAYHTAAYLWDTYSTYNGNLIHPTKPIESRNENNELLDTNGNKILTKRGKPLTNPYHPDAIKQLNRENNTNGINRYPTLTETDIIKTCFPNKYNERNHALLHKRAMKHLTEMETNNIITLHKEKNGYKILPPQHTINMHRATKLASKISKRNKKT